MHIYIIYSYIIFHIILFNVIGGARHKKTVSSPTPKKNGSDAYLAKLRRHDKKKRTHAKKNGWVIHAKKKRFPPPIKNTPTPKKKRILTNATKTNA